MSHAPENRLLSLAAQVRSKRPLLGSRPTNLIVVADLDFISDYFFQLRAAAPVGANFDNIAFFLNAIELAITDVAAESGFTRRGGLAPTLPEYTLEECVILLGYGEDALDGWLGDEIEAWPEYADYLLAQCRGSEQMRRGVLRDEVVFGISNRAVYAQSVAALGEPPTVRVELPPDYYYGGGAMAGAAGAAGAGPRA